MSATTVTAAIEQVRAVMGPRVASSEMQTRYSVIDPVLTALGWDTSDPDQVRLEYPLRSEGGVDYALLNRLQRPVIVVEAKRLGENPDRHARQLARYLGKIHARGESANIGVLTNGKNWHLYNLKAGVPFEDTYVESVDICEGDANDSAWRLLHWLDKAKWW